MTALFRVFAGRTPSDPQKGNGEPVPCDCGTSDISSLHVLIECSLMNVQRRPLLEGLPAGTTLTPALSIQQRYTALFVKLIRAPGLGRREKLTYDGDAPECSSGSE